MTLNWDDLRYFAAVTTRGSVTGAASDLGVNATTVSRRISALEDSLGVRLFDRRPTGWVTTASGEEILAAAGRMGEEAATIQRRALARDQELTGLLRVTSEASVFRYYLAEGISSMRSRYPGIEIQVVVSGELLDLGHRNADVAFRCTNEPPADSIAKKVAHIAYAIYGTEAVLQRCRRSKNGEGLEAITWIADGKLRPAWIQKGFPAASTGVRVDTLDAMIDLARAGLGIAQLPCGPGDSMPDLRRIPAPYVDPGWGLWALTHVDLRTTARVRLLRDHLIAEITRSKELIEGRAPE